MSYDISVKKSGFPVSDREKLRALIREAGLNRSQLARLIEVSYRTVYRWIEKGVAPHPFASHRIDELFKEQVDLRRFLRALVHRVFA
jgi:DNA-binding XRE family transcriptional regulator